jgi:hypothetical protein
VRKEGDHEAMQRIDKKVVIKHLKVLSIEMDLAESGVFR